MNISNSKKRSCSVCASAHVERRYCGVKDYEYGTYHEVDFLRCQTCGLLTQDPLPSPKLIPSFYPRSYRSHGHVEKKSLFSVLKYVQLWLYAIKIEHIVHQNKNAKVLEIGCGNGSLLMMLQRRGFSRLWGTDVSTVSAQALTQKGVVFRSANIEKKFPFGMSFDLIILNQVFEHLLDPLFVLARCKKHMAKNGKIIIATPNSSAIDLVLFRNYWDGLNAPRHFYLFSVKAMEIVRAKMGFQSLTSLVLPDPGMWAISLQNVLQDTGFFRTRLRHGLAWYTVFLSIVCLPISWITSVGKKSSSMLYILE